MIIEPTNPDERAAFVEKQLGADRAVLESFPPYVNIETINTCNARCIMCGIDFDSRVKTNMSEELFTKIVGELTAWRHHVRKVNLFFDCEPLLDRRLADKIATIKAAGIQVVTVATNASSLTATRARELIAAGLDEIYITIDSMVPEIYEKIRVGLKFDRVYANTRKFIQLRDEMGGVTKVRVQMVLQHANEEEPRAFVDHWQPLLNQGDMIVVHRAHNWGKAVDVGTFAGDENINHFPCTSLWSNAMIHADGSLALCSVDTEVGSSHTLGDVNTQSIEEIWRGAKMQAMRDRHLAGRRGEHALCDGCTAWRQVKNEVHMIIERKGDVA